MVPSTLKPAFISAIRFSVFVFSVVFLFGYFSSGLAQSSAGSNSAKFDDVKYLKTNDRKKAEEIEGSLLINSQTGEVLFLLKGAELLKIEKNNVTNVLYERDSKPRYAAGLLIAWPLLFTKSKKHFLTIQYKNASDQGEYAVFHLDKSNYKEILAAVEAATGVKVSRSID
ncbi:MAG: hypothetical protein JNK38_17755 [Acidobacteria bacterium]|nr:hypothetical protein [Acidobacteriota bacterium]